MNTLGTLLMFAALGMAPPSVEEVRHSNDPAKQILVRARLSRGEIRLSEDVRLTLSVEGPQPVSVSLPKAWPKLSPLWRIREEAIPLREKKENGRELWEQVITLSPLAAGASVTIPLPPLSVWVGTQPEQQIDWAKNPTIAVLTSIESPSIDQLRPVTEIETLPPVIPVESTSHGWRLAIPIALLTLGGVMIVWSRLKRKKPTQITDLAWVRSRLEKGVTSDQASFILRSYLTYRFHVPANHLTTPELLQKLRQDSNLLHETYLSLEQFLLDSDQARFSGSDHTGSDWSARTREVVSQLESNTPV